LRHQLINWSEPSGARDRPEFRHRGWNSSNSRSAASGMGRKQTVRNAVRRRRSTDRRRLSEPTAKPYC
jgi:hypothetical protein